MRRLQIAGLILASGLAVGACGSSGSTPAPAASEIAGPSIAAASLAPGKPIVTVDGARVHVEGLGVGISSAFTLTGNYVMTISRCRETTTTPFIVLRSATTGLAPTYVDQVTQLTNLSGKYNVEINPPPKCAWAIEFVPA